MTARRPNILFFHVDNLGMGELGCYGGGIVRGAETKRTDAFAREGLQLWHYIAEPQCTPSRSALMTGRYAIRSGTHTVPRDGGSQGLVAWERTIADVLSEAGYATACFGKWHLGAEDGRWPTDHGFDEWYGPPRSYDESRWDDNPWYRPDRDLQSYMHEGERDAGVRQLDDQPLTMELPARRRRRVQATRDRVPEEERRREPAVLPLLQPFAAARPDDPALRVPGRDRQRRLGRLPRRAGSRLRRPAGRARRARRRRRHDRRARRRQRRREPVDRAGQRGRLRRLVLHVLRGRAAHAVSDQMARRDRPGASVERHRPPDGHVHDAARMGRMPHSGRPRDRRRRPASVLRGLTGDVEPRGMSRLGHRRAPRRQMAELQGRLRATAVLGRGPAGHGHTGGHQPADRPEGTRELAGHAGVQLGARACRASSRGVREKHPARAADPGRRAGRSRAET